MAFRNGFRLAVAASVTLMLGVVASGSASAQTAEDAFGVWRHPENGSHVEMYKCGAGLCAKIVKSGDGQKTDDKNPDPAKKSRPIEGLVIMSGATKTGPSEWKGQLYNRADGGTYSGTLTVKSKSAIDLSGCTAAIFCKTVTWSRVK
jgi:uncharacterized protein (DUF2147 family)